MKHVHEQRKSVGKMHVCAWNVQSCMSCLIEGFITQLGITMPELIIAPCSRLQHDESILTLLLFRSDAIIWIAIQSVVSRNTSPTILINTALLTQDVQAFITRPRL